MAITFLDSAIGQRTDALQDLVKIFAENNDIVGRVPVFTIPPGTFIHTYKRQKTLPDITNRPLGGTYTATQTLSETKQTQLNMFGGKFSLDIQQNVPEEVSIQSEGLMTSGAATLQKLFFDGDASSGQFDGVNQICSDESQETSCGASGLAILASAANARTVFRNISSVVKAVAGKRIKRPDDFSGLVWFMDIEMHMALADAANLITGVQFSKNEILAMPTLYNIPIIYVTEDSSQDDILGFDETSPDTTKTDCGSLYLANIDARTGLAFVANGNNVAEMRSEVSKETVESITYLREMVVGLIARRSNCVHRLKDIRNATS